VLIDLCHIHTEAKVLGPVSLLKSTLILVEFILFESQIEPVGLDLFV